PVTRARSARRPLHDATARCRPSVLPRAARLLGRPDDAQHEHVRARSSGLGAGCTSAARRAGRAGGAGGRAGRAGRQVGQVAFRPLPAPATYLPPYLPDLPYLPSSMNVPLRRSVSACCSSAFVFITIGPYHATGSSIGLPDTSRNRIPSSPACTTISSPRSNSTSERLPAALYSTRSLPSVASVRMARGSDALRKRP